MENVLVSVEDHVWDFITDHKISNNVRKQLGEFMKKFRRDPRSIAINFEKIHNGRDPNYYSVRINQDYRGIVKKPSTGSVFLFLYVDKHDAAYKWAENHLCNIHPVTGHIQIYEEPDPLAPPTTAPNTPRLFDHISERNLLKLSVPQDLIAYVKTFTQPDDLENAKSKLPPDAYDQLFFVAQGFSVEEVLSSQQSSGQVKSGQGQALYGQATQGQEAQPQQQSQPPYLVVDTEDYVAALTNPANSPTFRVIDDEELDEMIDAPLIKWRVFMHSSQRRLVERDWNGPVRVSGGAGTGKTVVAIYRTKYLAEQVFNQKGDKILFTTYTKNLAIDIRNQLREICAADAFARIDVVNIDQWVKSYLQMKETKRFEIIYDTDNTYDWKYAVKQADASLELDNDFYWNEWLHVIQPQEIHDLEQYLEASRTGRGVSLNRRERTAVWRVFAKYRELQQSSKKRDWIEAMVHAREWLKQEANPQRYQAIIVDEVQDMSPQAMKLIRTLAGPQRANDLFIVGDPFQRIYNRRANLSHCNIQTRGRSQKLYINYRTTDEIRQWAVGLLDQTTVQDLEGVADHLQGYRSLIRGEVPQVVKFRTQNEEAQFIVRYLKQMDPAQHANCCLTARTNWIIEDYSKRLKASGIKTSMIGRDDTDDRSVEGVRLATMHRVKGLEFDTVIIPSVNADVLPNAKADELRSEDEMIREDYMLREKSLLYVAATRAKKELLVTCYGKPSPFIG
jgi:superfamily I DNA/RNA helicase